MYGFQVFHEFIGFNENGELSIPLYGFSDEDVILGYFVVITFNSIVWILQSCDGIADFKRALSIPLYGFLVG